MTAKKLAQGFDALVRDGGIGAALFFVVMELIFLNANSLQYIYKINSESSFTWIPAVLGSLAYSITTITVMRKQGHKALKIMFPIFDIFLMFFGLNLNTLNLIQQGNFNVISFILSIFFALFTGAITYSLGMINYKEQEDDNIDELKSENKELKLRETQLKDRLSIIEKYRTKFDKEKSKMQERLKELDLELSEFEKVKSKLKKHETENNELQSKNMLLERKIKEMKSQIIRYEASRIRKKKPENRTTEENEILELALQERF